jgi:autotransporter-associated beta strand protein
MNGARWKKRARGQSRAIVFAASISAFPALAMAQAWDGYAANAQHTALSSVGTQPLASIRWETPVDLDPQYSSGGTLYAHYGSPIITAQNTVIVPVKTGASGGFEVEALSGATGSVLWTQTSDYALPPTATAYYDWTPPYGPTLATGDTLYYAGDGGTVYERGSLNSPGSVTPTQEAFYGLANYEANKAAYNADVAISTPITADALGDIYFGYQTTSSAPGGLTNGIARISSTGAGEFFEADDLQVSGISAGMTQVVTNCAPALSLDGSTVYVAMSNGNFGTGRLVALNSATLTPTASVQLIDPKTGTAAKLPNDGTASPLVGPDGDVYMGVYDNANTSRGWMDHYSANLSVTKTPGGFGWDDTASIVPAWMVPSYHGTSTYLIMTKYNNYAGTGGNGQNMIAILDPNATQTDTRYNGNGAGGATMMQVVESIVGPTPDLNWTTEYPGAVDEWCINTAAVDPGTDSILVNSEDGHLYRWSLATNTLSQAISITSGLGEAYTPTEVGPDGTVYAINNATLFAVGASGSAVYSSWSASGSGSWSGSANWSTSIPTNAGDTATFSIAASGPTTLTLDGNRTVGTMNFANPDSYTIAQGTGGTLTIDNGTAGAQINDYYGNHTISAPLTLNSNTTIAVQNASNVFTISGNIAGAGGITLATASALSAGTVVLSGSNSYAGGTTVASGTLIIAANGALPDGDVAITGGLLQLATATGLARMTSLSITGAGALDLTNNHFVLSYTGTSPISTIAGYIKSGYNAGSWNGLGIISSAAAANTSYGVGYSDSLDPGNPANLSAGQIEVKYTLYGDANLDGAVNSIDFGILAANFGKSNRQWDSGDFNYDGTVDSIDFGALADNFGKSAGSNASVVTSSDWSALDAFASANGLMSEVPEPTAAGMLVAMSAGLCLQRRRKRRVFAAR